MARAIDKTIQKTSKLNFFLAPHEESEASGTWGSNVIK